MRIPSGDGAGEVGSGEPEHREIIAPIDTSTFSDIAAKFVFRQKIGKKGNYTTDATRANAKPPVRVDEALGKDWALVAFDIRISEREHGLTRL